jgi:hypothetical protein
VGGSERERETEQCTVAGTGLAVLKLWNWKRSGLMELEAFGSISVSLVVGLMAHISGERALYELSPNLLLRCCYFVVW